MRRDAVIVGAGLSGLYAARLLTEAGADFVLIEARERLGGRILSCGERGSESEDGFDLGPSWIWPRIQPAIAELVAELGLPAFPQNTEGDVVFERTSSERPHRYRSDAQEPHSMRLAGGTATLVRALARGIPVERLRLGARVSAMVLVEEGVDLRIDRTGGAPEAIEARVVIAALPPRLFEATVAFDPPQDQAIAERWRNTPTWMAPHAKFFAVYDRPIWREQGLSGAVQSMVGPMAEIHDATTASGRAALFGFVGVPAEQRTILGQEELARSCVEQFARVFGEEARNPRATLFKDWAADPLTATTADRAAEGSFTASAEPWVAGPWQRRLVLAGSETSPTEPGYLAGALIAARRAADETLGRLRAP